MSRGTRGEFVPLPPIAPAVVAPAPKPAPAAVAETPKPAPSTTIKVQLATDTVTLEVAGWSHRYTDAGEAANVLLSLYQIKPYDLPRMASRSDNQYSKGIRADGKDDARVLESHGLVESPPWGEPVPDVLGALLDPSKHGALFGPQITEMRFARALRGELGCMGIRQTPEMAQEPQAQAVEAPATDMPRMAVAR